MFLAIIVILAIGFLTTFVLVFEQRRTVAKVSCINIYPIKSCGGMEVKKARITAQGFQFDRMFMIVDSSGKFVSQRILPKMALIKPIIDYKNDKMIVKIPSMPDLEVSLLDHTVNEIIKVQLRKQEIEAIDVGEEAALWLSEVLEEDVKLVKMDKYAPRPLDEDVAGPNRSISFSDTANFMLASEGSLLALNDHLPEDKQISMRRFRPKFPLFLSFIVQ